MAAGAPCLRRDAARSSSTEGNTCFVRAPSRPFLPSSPSSPCSSVSPPARQVDLVIVDFGVNDAVIERVDFNLEYIRMAHEILIRHARNDMSSSPALIYAEGYIPPSHVVNTPWQSENMAEVHAEVTQKYDIPMVSQARGEWGGGSCFCQWAIARNATCDCFGDLVALGRVWGVVSGWRRAGGG